MPVGSGLKVLIVGGGLIGCGCGYFLSRAGARVTILEENFLSSGASGANAGLLSLGVPERPDVAHLYGESRRLMLEEMEPEIGDFEMVRSGILYVAMDDTGIQALKMRADAFRATGIAFTELTAGELLQEEPRLSPGVAGGLLARESGNFNPFLLNHGLARCLTRNGGSITTGVSVKSIEKDGRGFSLKTDGDTYTADAVVLANGWQARELAEPLGITLPVVPARGQIIISEPLAPFARKAIHSTHHIYMRQTESGTCQIGSHTEFVGPDRGVTLEKLGAYAREISEMIPFFGKVRMLRAYAGLRPLTPDSLPIVEKAPGLDGLVLACGHSRTGASLSVVTGKIVSELLLEGRSSLDISPWSLARFDGKTYEEFTNGR